MSKQILYQAKSKITNNWFEGFYIENQSGDSFIRNKEDFKTYLVDSNTVCRLLHVERNGRRWFEGDIAKLHVNTIVSGHPVIGNEVYINQTYVGVVQMHVSYGLSIKVTEIVDNDTGDIVSVPKNLYKTISFYRSEIIGNIFEK